jgi:methionine synthase I (cobalamin-dependent)/5,10-methylenetetrahydrofolate reductase
MNNNELTELFNRELLIFDGAMGTELYRRHVFTNRCYDELCFSDPNLVMEIHQDYLRAGADVLTSNSYGANRSTLKKFALSDQVVALNGKALELMRSSVAALKLKRRILLAGSIGPLEKTAQNQCSPDQGGEILAEQAKALIEAGADFLIFETLPDRAAVQMALLAMAQLPAGTAFVLSHAIPDDGDLPELIAHRLEAMQPGLPEPFALGLNCGLGPARMLEALEAIRTLTPLPIIAQPNAGTPHKIDNRQLYLCSPEYLSTYAARYVRLGARAVGGCCGTTPEHIQELARSIKPLAKQKTEILLKRVDREKVVPCPETSLAEKSRLGGKLARGEWVSAVEIAPPRGWDTSKIIASGELCKKYAVDTINIPDGPRAAPRLSAMITALKIQELTGLETVLHVCARDRNFLALQADLLGCAASGLKNILFITGDPPKLGGYGFASGVFDTDSIGLISLQKHLNQGIDLGGQAIKPPTAAVIGAGADPNAIDFDCEIERVRRKVEAGAEYITTQPIFAAAALERFCKAIEPLKVPVIAGIWPLASLRNALFMKNEVPGVVVPDEIIRRIERCDTREEQLAAGIQIAREAVEQVRGMVAGIQVSAPLGNVQTALEVIV